MSNENKAKKRKYGEIEPVAIEKAESTALKSILSRMRNRDDDSESDESAQPTAPTSRTAGTAGTSRTTRTPRTARPKQLNPIAPERDFTRVANSINREAVPAGIFKSKSYQLYNVLYQMTRGAVVPKRAARVIKPKLMKASGIGSERTFLKSLAALKETGLIKITDYSGQHEGNLYEVFIPEEIGLQKGNIPTSRTDATHPRHALQEVGTPPSPKSDVPDVALQVIESTGYSESNTFSFNTSSANSEKRNFDDDEPLGEFLRVMNETHVQLTGKKPTYADVMKWKELAELLSIELKIAAARTPNGVSNVPAFFVKHLSTRLFKKNSQEMKRESVPTALEEQGSVKDVSQCSDCKGSGWYYPNGYESGVVKCKHEKLLS